jgi:hypothetical protein
MFMLYQNTFFFVKKKKSHQNILFWIPFFKKNKTKTKIENYKNGWTKVTTEVGTMKIQYPI